MAINAQLLLEAIEALEVERGISRDVIVASNNNCALIAINNYSFKI